MHLRAVFTRYYRTLILDVEPTGQRGHSAAVRQRQVAETGAAADGQTILPPLARAMSCYYCHAHTVLLLLLLLLHTRARVFRDYTGKPVPESFKKLSYRRVTARCVLSVVILPITTQQCRNYLYDKF